jgi:hypothetical protein
MLETTGISEIRVGRINQFAVVVSQTMRDNEFIHRLDD